MPAGAAAQAGLHRCPALIHRRERCEPEQPERKTALMAKKKPASLTGALLACKGEARVVGYAVSTLGSYKSMDSAGAPKRQARAMKPASPARPYPPLVKKRVLIVEDNELDMKLFRDLLELHGCSVLRARDGREALALAQESRPDLILMDMHLPGASGLEVTRWFKEDEDLRSIPVIAATAHAMDGEDELFVNLGCETCIAKPISITAFLRTCARALPSAGPASQTQ